MSGGRTADGVDMQNAQRPAETEGSSLAYVVGVFVVAAAIAGATLYLSQETTESQSALAGVGLADLSRDVFARIDCDATRRHAAKCDGTTKIALLDAGEAVLVPTSHPANMVDKWSIHAVCKAEGLKVWATRPNDDAQKFNPALVASVTLIDFANGRCKAD